MMCDKLLFANGNDDLKLEIILRPPTFEVNEFMYVQANEFLEFIHWHRIELHLFWLI